MIVATEKKMTVAAATRAGAEAEKRERKAVVDTVMITVGTEAGATKGARTEKKPNALMKAGEAHEGASATEMEATGSTKALGATRATGARVETSASEIAATDTIVEVLAATRAVEAHTEQASARTTRIAVADSIVALVVTRAVEVHTEASATERMIALVATKAAKVHAEGAEARKRGTGEGVEAGPTRRGNTAVEAHIGASATKIAATDLMIAPVVTRAAKAHAEGGPPIDRTRKGNTAAEGARIKGTVMTTTEKTDIAEARPRMMGPRAILRSIAEARPQMKPDLTDRGTPKAVATRRLPLADPPMDLEDDTQRGQRALMMDLVEGAKRTELVEAPPISPRMTSPPRVIRLLPTAARQRLLMQRRFARCF